MSDVFQTEYKQCDMNKSAVISCQNIQTKNTIGSMILLLPNNKLNKIGLLKG